MTAADATTDTTRTHEPAMTLLETRWNRLALPRWPLVVGPTPLERRDELLRALGLIDDDAELWIKRDDLTHPLYGGNKVRKLERLLGDAIAKDADTLVTTGAAGSHHVLATGLFARRRGLAVHAVLVPQRSTEHVTLDLRAMLGQGIEVHPVARFAAVPAAMAAIAARLRLKGHRPYVIPPGGSSVMGALGYVEAGLELAQQMLEARMLEPDAIVAALGTGGTVAGLAVGLSAAGCLVPIHAVRVTSRKLVRRTMLVAQIRAVVEQLRRSDDRFPRIEELASNLVRIDEDELGDGYGLSTPRAREAIRIAREHDLVLDDTYTGKAFAAVLRLLRDGTCKRVVYVHTLSGAPLAPLVRDAPPIPHRLDRLLV